MGNATGNRPVAVVTGASRGIGKAIARRLAADGHDLMICGTRLETIEAAAVEIAGETGARVEARAVDVSDREQVQGFVREAVGVFGRLDVLVNNAGITRDNLALRMKPEEWAAVIETNLTAVFHACQAALKPMMKARAGRIINISSVVAGMGNPGQANYCASKGGVEAMTRSLAHEVGGRGITVNAVAPGFIETDMTAALGEDARAQLTAKVPLGRLGAPEDVAAAVAFLAGPDAGYITGHVLHVNGGMHM
ncbi:MAG: 3-oxoacyl-ACP reductase FabG [Mariprofundaceae bacterium]